MSVTVTTQLNNKFSDDSNFYFGLILAVSSSLFIGSSFIIKKKALIRLGRKGSVRAGAGGFGYLKEYIWWIGLICMGIGEISNFAAYAFAPASLVTPLGALSVLVSAILSSIYLKENLNLLGKLGCILCILGSTMIVIHSPMIENHETIHSLVDKLQETTFILYIGTIFVIVLSIMFHFGPKYGSRNVVWYLILCSAVGSLTVMSCKSLGISIREHLEADSPRAYDWLPYVLLSCVFICICVQMMYLNRALDLFNTSIVTPVYYVFFTSFVLAASTVLFKEWQTLGVRDIIGSVCGFCVIIIAVILLNAFKNVDINLSDIRGIFRPKRELVGTAELNGNVSFTRSI